MGKWFGKKVNSLIKPYLPNCTFLSGYSLNWLQENGSFCLGIDFKVSYSPFPVFCRRHSHHFPENPRKVKLIVETHFTGHIGNHPF